MTVQISTDLFGPAKWIVDPTLGSGTHTTIASALTSASSGDTIFIRPGTYTENLTLKVGVNLTAFPTDSSLNGTGNVIINGTCTLSTAGSVTISGIQLQTNSANAVVVSGSVASILNLNNCYLNFTNSDGISYSSSSASSAVNINNCYGDLGTTGIKIFADSSAGTLSILFSKFTNSGASLTASTKSAGILTCRFCTFSSSFTYSSSDTTSLFQNCNFKLETINTTNITTSGTGTLTSQFCQFSSGTASALSIGTGTTCAIRSCQITSSNTNAITGLGSVINTGMIFSGTSVQSNVTTQSGGAASGITQGTAPSAGFIGEQLSSGVTNVSMTSTVIANVTSVSLTAGIWDVSAVVNAHDTTQQINTVIIAISLNSASTTGTVLGNSRSDFSASSSIWGDITQSIPSFRVTTSAASTTYFLVCQINAAGGTLTANGRISATRVG